ncbi:MAG: Flp pilus assembly protein CpaB [Elusimicrobiota bacterium]|jgi:pilus assembly protein CpaB|nr:Flp pilus assembly protein CpaB [Elusimicrobiota bacterium]
MRKTLILSGGLALLCAATAFLYLSSLEKSYKTMTDPIKVVAARQRIPQGSTLRAEYFEEILVPKEYVQPKAFSSIEALFPANTKTVYVSLTAIEKGEQILSTKISKPNEGTGISNIIPDGHKALSIDFDNAPQGILAPGSSIDIISIIQYTDKDKRPQEAAYTTAQNVLVLAVGSNFLGMAQNKNDEEAQAKPTVTIAVTLEQAQTIMLAQENGKVRYVIRPSGDNEILKSGAIKISDIVKDISSINPIPTEVDGNTQKIMNIINRYSK